ncbi:hypothetical protein F7Q99_11150 [Streptomyces kaniharaensis]|uniref:Uncharacterized protein n=1 Tax=Streptomyces kaniharaensis TaxID=212423 RepID=A0A6N7KS64_9ACTN|nr:hypothetical protein [Streptomyces kaniharaensis]MQS12834.1 hypothetical protein [Streptomyces kaniharaensis]
MNPTLALAGVLLCGVVSGAIRAWRDVLVLRRLERLMTGCSARQRAEVARTIATSFHRPERPARPSIGLADAAPDPESGEGFGVRPRA